MMNPARKPADETTYSGRFAARLRALREKTGMTGQEAARAITEAGFTIKQTTYYNWESGRSEPPINAFPVIAEVFGLKSPRSLLPAE